MSITRKIALLIGLDRSDLSKKNNVTVNVASARILAVWMLREVQSFYNSGILLIVFFLSLHVIPFCCEVFNYNRSAGKYYAKHKRNGNDSYARHELPIWNEMFWSYFRLFFLMQIQLDDLFFRFRDKDNSKRLQRGFREGFEGVGLGLPLGTPRNPKATPCEVWIREGEKNAVLTCF